MKILNGLFAFVTILFIFNFFFYPGYDRTTVSDNLGCLVFLNCFWYLSTRPGVPFLLKGLLIMPMFGGIVYLIYRCSDLIGAQSNGYVNLAIGVGLVADFGYCILQVKESLPGSLRIKSLAIKSKKYDNRIASQ